MEIHIFIAHMGVGGAERVCVNLANEFVKLKHQVHIVVLNLENDINTHLLDKEVQVHELNVSRLRYSFFPMIGYIRRFRPQFLFVFGLEMAVILNKMKKLHLIKLPVVTRVLNNINISLSKEDHVSPVVEKYLQNAQKQLRDMDHVIAQCEAMGQMLLDAKVVEENQCTVVYNPVSAILVEKVSQLRKKVGNNKNEILFVGRIDPQKNIPHLLQAFQKVHKLKPDLCLRLVGDGNLTEQMKELSRELGIADAVIFDGIRKDMDNVYAGASLVALSSEYEGMPNCLIEAIGSGIPVVSYDCPLGPREIIVDGENGYLVSYNDVNLLAEKMIDCLNKEWNEDRIKETARKFELKEIARQYITLFSQLH